MKRAMVVALALSFALWTGAASAQQGTRQPGAVESAAYEYGNYYAQDEQASPSDRPAPEPEPEMAPVEAEPACAAPADACCDDCCRSRRHLFCRRPALECCEDDPWRLFECYNESNCHGIKIYGWLNAGVTANDTDPDSNYNGTVTFNDREELQMNQAYVVAERTIDTCGCGWDFGGRLDLLYGTDSRFTEARGLETDQDLGTKWNTSPFYGLAMPQAYMEVGYNDLAVKLGHYYAPIGYEGVMATSNFFYSHAYMFQYGEPFTQTGALATWQGSETTRIIGGIDRGWDNWEDDLANRINFTGGLNWDGGEGRTLALTGTMGQEPTDPNPAVIDERYLVSLVASFELTDRLTYVFWNDYGFQDRGRVDLGEDAEWYGITQYLLYKMSCCWSLGARFEWFRDDDGTRVRGIGDRRNGHPLGGTRFVGDFYEMTFGANWSPNANLIVRPELRFDYFDGVTNNANVGPFDDGRATDQVTAAVDFILKY